LSTKEIIEYIGPSWERVRVLMKNALHTDVSLLESTNETLLGHSGKMLRPMITLLIAKALGCINDDTVHYAAAIELLHNATLLHDDVADESLERRGQPTVSSILGPSSAVLIGDFWLARSVELVVSTTCHDRVINLFSKTLTDLAEGEMLQLEKASSADTEEDDYFRIIFCKTASLFETAAACAAVSVGASEDMQKAACDFGRYLGIAFQIKDDILDYTGTEQLGKPVGSDLREKKITLPLLGILAKSPRSLEIRNMVKTIETIPDGCMEISEIVRQEGGLEYAAAKLQEYIVKAVSALDRFPDGNIKSYLKEIVEYNAIRAV